MTYKTGKRGLILELLSRNSDRALTIDEICEEILGGTGGKSTVYRLMGDLTSEGLVRRLTEGTDRVYRYQYLGGACHDHLHLRCSECGVLVHLDCEASHRVQESVRLTGFTLDEGAVLSGECEKCRKGGKR